MTKTVEHRRAKSAILDAVHEGAAGLYALSPEDLAA